MRALHFAFAMVLMSCNSALAFDLDASAKTFQESIQKPPVFVTPLRGWAGYDSAIASLRHERVVDADHWRTLWASHAPGTTPPDIDFRTEMVVGIFSGVVRPTPISLYSVVEDATTIEITTMGFGYDVIDDQKMSHYLFIVLPWSNKGIAFVARSWSLMAKPQLFYHVAHEMRPLNCPRSGCQ
jgi:hypothetical protein